MTQVTQAPPQGRLLDYEQFIEHQLSRTRARIKWTDIGTALLILLAAVVGTLLVEVVLDHAVGLPLIARRLILIVGLTAALVYSLLKIVMPMVMSVNTLYAAKTIENTDPAFKNSLLNYLTLRGYRDRIPKAVMATVEARAVSDLSHVEVEQAVNQQFLMKSFYVLCGVIAAFTLYAAFAPKSILDSTRRALLADVVRPTNTRLLGIKPGDAEVVAGSQVIFSVDTNQGLRPNSVKLHSSVDGGKFYSVKEFEPGAKQYDPWQLTLNNVQQTMDYYVTGGDAESLHYTLNVHPAPMVTEVSIDYDFPSYTGVAPRRDIEGGNVEAIEGTKVTVHARTNEPAQSGTLDLTADSAAPMTVSPEDAHQLTGQFVVRKSGTYTIKFRTTGNQLNPNPVVYDIHSIADRPPQARFLRPDRPNVKVPANVKLDLIMSGSDDHGVRDATLRVTLDRRDTLISKNVLEGRKPSPEFKATEQLDLAQLRVRPGQSLQYSLTVRDSREPAAHSFSTPSQTIEIIEPVAPAEKKKIEEKQQEDRTQLEEQKPANEPEAQDPNSAAEEQPENQDPNANPQEGGNEEGEKKGASGDQGGAESRPNDQAQGDPNQPGGPDQAAGADSNEEGQQKRENPSNPPANDSDLRKLQDGLQKKGLLDKQKPPREGQRPDAQNPENSGQRNAGDASEKSQGNRSKSSGNPERGQQGQSQDRDQKSRQGDSQTQSNQGDREQSPEVQRGQKGDDQSRDSQEGSEGNQGAGGQSGKSQERSQSKQSSNQPQSGDRSQNANPGASQNESEGSQSTGDQGSDRRDQKSGQRSDSSKGDKSARSKDSQEKSSQSDSQTREANESEGSNDSTSGNPSEADRNQERQNDARNGSSQKNDETSTGQRKGQPSSKDQDQKGQTGGDREGGQDSQPGNSSDQTPRTQDEMKSGGRDPHDQSQNKGESGSQKSQSPDGSKEQQAARDQQSKNQSGGEANQKKTGQGSPRSGQYPGKAGKRRRTRSPRQANRPTDRPVTRPRINPRTHKREAARRIPAKRRIPRPRPERTVSRSPGMLAATIRNQATSKLGRGRLRIRVRRPRGGPIPRRTTPTHPRARKREM